MRIISILLILAPLYLGCSSSENTRTGRALETTPVVVYQSVTTLNVDSPVLLHGAGFARYSNYDAERSFKEAKKNANIDFAASLLTSVYLEYYGTNTQPTQLRAEFAIADTLSSSNLSSIDSTKVGDWAVYYLQSDEFNAQIPENVSSGALSLNWTGDLLEPTNIHGYWISSGWVDVNVFNPNRGWTLARQEALKNLSLNRSSVVQANERLYNESYSSINYTTSKHVFREIHTIGRKMVGEKLFVLIAVKDENIVQIDE